MKFGRAPKALKSARKEAELTQQQLSMDDQLFLSRESVSHQECGRHKVQPEVAQVVVGLAMISCEFFIFFLPFNCVYHFLVAISQIQVERGGCTINILISFLIV